MHIKFHSKTSYNLIISSLSIATVGLAESVSLAAFYPPLNPISLAPLTPRFPIDGVTTSDFDSQA